MQPLFVRRSAARQTEVGVLSGMPFKREDMALESTFEGEAALKVIRKPVSAHIETYGTYGFWKLYDGIWARLAPPPKTTMGSKDQASVNPSCNFVAFVVRAFDRGVRRETPPGSLRKAQHDLLTA
jgi:hypothetical protein